MAYLTRAEFNENRKRCMQNINHMVKMLNMEDHIKDIEKYIATYDETESITADIIKKYTGNSNLVTQPIPKISLNLAPQASGKSMLNTYSVKKLHANCVVINSDELKKFYPRAYEISNSKFSPLYSYITDIGSNLFTSVLLKYCLEAGYNVIFEGTGKSLRILDTIRPYKNKYRIKIRTIGVSAMTSLSSILVRYMGQKQKDDCARLVRAVDFISSYQNIVTLCDVAESEGYIVEVFARANTESKLPIKLYSSHQRKGYENAVQAIYYARKHNNEMCFEKNLELLEEVKNFLIKNKESNVLAEALDIFYHIIIVDKLVDYDDAEGF